MDRNDVSTPAPPRRLVRASAWTLAFGALTLACKSEQPTPAPPPSATASAKLAPSVAPSAEPPAPPRSYNVLLIMIDSLRADMPWAGYPRDIAPRLNELRKQRCVSYENAYSLSSYTAKSVAPALVDEYPSAMVRDGWFFTRYPDDKNLFVTERAKSAGHRTFAGHAHGYFLKSFGINQGFDDWRLLPEGVDLKAVESVTSEPLTRLALEMLKDEKNTRPPGDKRFFAYFHYMDPHHTYEPHPDSPQFGRKLRDMYDTEVHYTDSWLGKLLDFASEQAWWKDTAVIITADHGEGFGERKHFRHGFELWESLIKVPLFICLPDVPPRTIGKVRRGHIDLAPTIADLMRLPAGPKFRGESLLPEITGKIEPKPKRVVADLPRADLMDRRRAVIDGDWKIVAFGDDRHFMLFDLAADPWEEKDLGSERPEKLEQMKRVYAEVSSEIPLVEVLPGPALKGAPAGRRW